MPSLRPELVIALIFGALGSAWGQEFGPPDRQSPGDEQMQAYLARAAAQLDAGFLEGIKTKEDWERIRPRLKEEYLYMLGLMPLPEKTPLAARITGTLQYQDVTIERLHYQSRPGLYVTANLYRPAKLAPGAKLPAVLYVCGHSSRGRNGNKTAFQAHGLWFARHGYICLAVDTLQLGEIAALHHGTYREERWWWHSRGYTPAGVECWNGVRGIDYLASRPEVDAGRIAVTGISGGGAATFWIAAADERAAVAVPVSGMADLESYVGNRVINGHCDCMFLYNTFRWPWTRIAALVAPRPLLFSNSDNDRIFPMDANDRISNRLERLYSLFGASDRVDALVSIGGHAYRQDIRQGVYRFLNTYLRNDPRLVTDSEVDLVGEAGREQRHPIPPEDLRVFPTDADLPADELNTTIDQHFVPLARVAAPAAGGFDAWKEKRLAELRRVCFGHFPKRLEPARPRPPSTSPDSGAVLLETEAGVVLPVRVPAVKGTKPGRVLLAVLGPDEAGTTPAWLAPLRQENDLVVALETRGIGATRWTRKNPPNYVERCCVLLGRTVDSGRVWDVCAVARYLAAQQRLPVHAAGGRHGGLVALYAALLEPEISGLTLVAPPASHAGASAPQLLNVLRVCDVPEACGMLAPRPLTIVGDRQKWQERVAALYATAGAADQLRHRPAP